MSWPETINNIVGEVTKRLSNVNIEEPIISFDTCFADTFSDKETFIVDSLGAFKCKLCHQGRLCPTEDYSGVLVCKNKVESYARKYNIPEDVLAIYVFLHELCHLMVHVHLPDKYRKIKIPNMLNLEEPFCEFVALLALEKGIFEMYDVKFKIEKIEDHILQNLHAKLRRPPPYSLYTRHYMLPYKLGIINRRKIEREILQLYEMFSSNIQDVHDLLGKENKIIYYLSRKLRRLKHHISISTGEPCGCARYKVIIAYCW